MIRVIGFGIVCAVLAAVVFNGNTFAMWAGLLFGLAVALLPVIAGTGALRCPFCRKRVKLGASVCHHCGRQVGRKST